MVRFIDTHREKFGVEPICRGNFANSMEMMSPVPGIYKGKSDLYVGFSGDPLLPPGTYKLGAITVKAISGSPRIWFTSNSQEIWWAQTSFGSANPGKDGLNTLIYSDDPLSVSKVGEPGDWSDADGVQFSQSKGASSEGDLKRFVFGVSISPNPSNPAGTITVTTSTRGFLRVRLFGPDGRAVRTLFDRSDVPEGAHRISPAAFGRMASGVYFYRVEATEGRRTGRIVVAK